MAAILASSALALTGCSFFGGNSESGTDGDTAVELADDGTVKDSQATYTRTYRGYDVTVDVVRMARHDKALRAEFAVTPRSRGETSQLSPYAFGGPDSVDGVYLLDTANLRKYTVLMSADDSCICSDDLPGFPLDKTTLVFADFPVPPESVKQLALVVPGLGPLPATPLL